MSPIFLRLPESLHQRARTPASREGVSINQLIATALAEKISALDVDYLRARGAQSSKESFLAALAESPDVAPDEGGTESRS